jgi:hypothetical protein
MARMNLYVQTFHLQYKAKGECAFIFKAQFLISYVGPTAVINFRASLIRQHCLLLDRRGHKIHALD